MDNVKELTGKLTGIEQGEKRIVAKIEVDGKVRSFSTFDKNLIPQNLVGSMVDIEYTTTVKGEFTYNNIQDIRKHEVTEHETMVDIQKDEAIEKYQLDMKKVNEVREMKIIKQSCLKAAVEFHKGEAGLTPNKIIETTKVFVSYVMDDE